MAMNEGELEAPRAGPHVPVDTSSESSDSTPNRAARAAMIPVPEVVCNVENNKSGTDSTTASSSTQISMTSHVDDSHQRTSTQGGCLEDIVLADPPHSVQAPPDVIITVDPVGITNQVQEQISVEEAKLKAADGPSNGDVNSPGKKSPFHVKWDYLRLFRYSTRFDIFLLTAGVLCAMGAGVPLPLIGIIFGNLINDFSQKLGDPSKLSSDELEAFQHSINTKVSYLVYVAIGYFLLTYAYCVCWSLIGERVGRKLREEYVAATLRMEVGWFAEVGAGEVSNRITSDIQTIHLGTSEKVGICIQSVSYFVVALAVSFSKSAQLAGIMLAIVPAFVIVIMGGSKITAKYTTRASDAYSKASALTEEAFGNVRMVQAFNSQERLARVYESLLTVAEREGVRKSVAAALMMGAIFFLAYSSNALAYWQGSRLIVNNSVDGAGDVFTVIFMMLDTAFIIGHFSPFLQTFAFAAGAGCKLLDTIDRVSSIDPTSEAGFRPAKCQGALELRDVRFVYPTRPDVEVLKGVNLVIEQGKTTAIVGLSGSGKSTVVSLVERFHDPTSGQIFLDGIAITSLNLRWLRHQMALVMQEPVLFNGTIMENIALGLAHHPTSLTQEEKDHLCIQAARDANAHGFVSKLPEGYDTRVGERGMGLSGGQKQRIAIARAIVSDPKILLLDEATSALDVQSERIVQSALDRASENRTTIVIAHRLSTVKNAHKIVVMAQGTIIEQGTHAELLALGGAYYRAVQTQNIGTPNATPLAVTSVETEDIVADELIVNELKTSIRGDSRSDKTIVESKFTVENGRISGDKSGGPVDSVAHNSSKITTWRLVQRISGMMGRWEWVCVALGLLTSAMIGSVYSFEAVIFSNLVTTLSFDGTGDASKMLEVANRFCLYFMAIAVTICFAHSTNGTVFGWVSGRLLWRVRSLSFRSIVHQDISYFDTPDRTAASLVSALNVDANHLSGLTGVVIGTVFSIMVNLTAGITLAHVVAWKIALVVVLAVPIMLVAGFLRVRIIARFQKRHETAYVSSAALAAEAIGNIKTVAALSCENVIRTRYHDSLEGPYQDSLRSISSGNFWLALAYSITYLLYAMAYWWGSRLLSKGEYSVQQFFIVLPALLFSAQASGQMFSLAPDVTKARVAAANIFRVIDSKGNIGFEMEVVKEMQQREKRSGLGVEFKDVWFTYPSRPELPVLKGLSLKIEPGQFVAFVGESGCGKSTAVALIERFYDPDSGTILLNNTPLPTLPIHSQRSRIALVNQEPTLYEGTIRFNILIGSDKPAHEITESEFLHVCHMANVHEFVALLPDGYETVVGNKGSGLSGGQKQRIAIARALLRNPEVLLLDEATSALDSESERVVQTALNEASKNQTTISIAHRLSTIRHADRIFVFDRGVVVESGTHDELEALRGKYFAMVQVQKLGGDSEE
ncbi:ABC multidrug transporter Mdr1 [Powellomyces hirtus]|nr:ABC multidrug transporter Mdr1 [Powellomyces hirtus]